MSENRTKFSTNNSLSSNQQKRLYKYQNKKENKKHESTTT